MCTLVHRQRAKRHRTCYRWSHVEARRPGRDVCGRSAVVVVQSVTVGREDAAASGRRRRARAQTSQTSHSRQRYSRWSVQWRLATTAVVALVVPVPRTVVALVVPVLAAVLVTMLSRQQADGAGVFLVVVGKLPMLRAVIAGERVPRPELDVDAAAVSESAVALLSTAASVVVVVLAAVRSPVSGEPPLRAGRELSRTPRSDVTECWCDDRHCGCRCGAGGGRGCGYGCDCGCGCGCGCGDSIP
mmetsp:Transcript_3117/g.9726  ORF Transcript_3117/g.9726 Transcript_3117/m.9726 type:complete len:244 (+) Transcript_3117:2141-2872(+)